MVHAQGGQKSKDFECMAWAQHCHSLFQVKVCSRLTSLEIAFLVVSLVVLAGVFAFTFVSLARAVQITKPSSGQDLTFAIIILINAGKLFCLSHKVDALEWYERYSLDG